MKAIRCGILVLMSNFCLITHSNMMVTDTAHALDLIRSRVLRYAKDVKKDISLPTWLIGFGMKAMSLEPIKRSNAMIARPFFVVKGADNCLSTIGSWEADIKYLKSVFEEFYASGELSFHHLITILHRHMMVELGLPTTKSLEQFKHVMEKTNKHGFPVMLNKDQFTIYARCVARGLYAVYWFENGYL